MMQILYKVFRRLKFESAKKIAQSKGEKRHRDKSQEIKSERKRTRELVNK